MTTPPVKWCDVEVDDDDGVPRNPQSTAGSMIDAGGCGCVFVVVSIAAGVEMNDVGRLVGSQRTNERFLQKKTVFSQSV